MGFTFVFQGQQLTLPSGAAQRDERDGWGDGTRAMPPSGKRLGKTYTVFMVYNRDIYIEHQLMGYSNLECNGIFFAPIFQLITWLLFMEYIWDIYQCCDNGHVTETSWGYSRWYTPRDHRDEVLHDLTELWKASWLHWDNHICLR